MSAPYKPYKSDSESESGSESDTSFSSDSSSSSYASLINAQIPRNFRALADGLSLSRIGGANSPPDTTTAGGFPITNGFATFSNFQMLLVAYIKS